MEKYFLMNQWICLLLKRIKAKRGFQRQMRIQGHLSHHVFSTNNTVRDISLEHVIRMLLNYAMNCSHTEKRQEFLDEWMRIGIYIQNFADSEEIDQFNQLFIPQKRNNLKKNEHRSNQPTEGYVTQAPRKA